MTEVPRRSDADPWSPAVRADVAAVLHDGGVVLAPSDSAWSVAAIPLDTTVPARLSEVLGRRRSPFSLSFPSVAAAREWVAPDARVDRLLRAFCPGAITVVCAATRHGLPWELFDDTVGAADRTVGVRVSRSAVERAVAGATPYPVTTVPVVEPDGVFAPDEQRARDAVGAALDGAGLRWMSVPGAVQDLGGLSTVVRIERGGLRTVIREGPRVSRADIDAVLASAADAARV